jgi:hypothetical protein
VCIRGEQKGRRKRPRTTKFSSHGAKRHLLPPTLGSKFRTLADAESLSFPALDAEIDSGLETVARDWSNLVPYLLEMNRRLSAPGKRSDMRKDAPAGLTWTAWVESKRHKLGRSLRSVQRLLRGKTEASRKWQPRPHDSLSQGSIDAADLPTDAMGVATEMACLVLRMCQSSQNTVTYKNQPAMEETKGAVPLEGTRHLYTVKKVLWPEEVSEVLQSLLISRSLHVCCGHSPLGDIRCDFDAETNPDVLCDAANLPFADESFESVLCDPPFNGRFQWNHDVLSELSRVTSKRIIFQHWFIPSDPDGLWKKWHKFQLSEVYIWQPKTYFGRVQVISVFDAQRP